VVFNSFKRTIAAAFIVGLAACAGQSSMVPTQSTQSTQPLATQALSSSHLSINAPLGGAFGTDFIIAPDAASPCKQLASKGFFYFKGTCILKAVKPAGGTVALAAYKGISLSFGVKKNNAPSAGVAFLIGEGTSSADITGTFNDTKFPNYAATNVPCLTPAGNATPCIGKAVVYALILNTTSTFVSFPSLPSSVVKAAAVGTKQCHLIALGFKSGGIAGEWFHLPSTGVPKNGSVSMKAPKGELVFTPQSFTVLGWACK
jgi:hypothetical protein